MPLTMRPATRADAAAVYRIRVMTAEQLTARLGRGHWSRTAPLASVRRRLTPLGIATSPMTLYVVCDDSEPVATIAYGSRSWRTWPRRAWRQPDAHALCVFDVAVAPDRQRQGIGRWTMLAAEEAAGQRGLAWVRLDAYSHDPVSGAFYRSLGYEDRGAMLVMGAAVTLFEKHVGA
jgi:GNAT superfamily N-acetyltransferase